jgi:hypothetical protein
LAIGYWLLAIGSWLLALGFWLLALGSWYLAFGIESHPCREAEKQEPASPQGWGTHFMVEDRKEQMQAWATRPVSFRARRGITP